MVKGNMRVSEIIAIYEKSRQESRVPYKPKRQAEDFETIFKQKCKEVKDGKNDFDTKN